MKRKDFNSMFDSIKCSADFCEHMEQLLQAPPQECVEFSETVSDYATVHKQRAVIHWISLAVACIVIVCIGGAAGLSMRRNLPSDPALVLESMGTAVQETTADSTTISEQQITEETKQTSILQTSALHTKASYATTQALCRLPLASESIATDCAALETEATSTINLSTDTTTTCTQTVKTDAEPTNATETFVNEAEAMAFGYVCYKSALEFDTLFLYCPYRYDYMNMEGRAFEQDGVHWFPVTDPAVSSVTDVKADFYKLFTEDWDSSFIDTFFLDTKDGLYYCGDTLDSSDVFSDYELVFVSASDTELEFTAIVSCTDGSQKETSFVLIMTEDGWRISEYSTALEF